MSQEMGFGTLTFPPVDRHTDLVAAPVKSVRSEAGYSAHSHLP
jgi:hypothetical protein